MCKIYDFGGVGAQTYKEKCTCGRIVEVSAQQDNDPEFYTTIYVKCICGKSVEFTLPYR